MARLVGVCRSEDYPYERRQLPLAVDQNLTVIVAPIYLTHWHVQSLTDVKQSTNHVDSMILVPTHPVPLPETEC